jgi:hypothetical protein
MPTRLFVSSHLARKHRWILHISQNSHLQTFTPKRSFSVIICQQKKDVGVETSSNFVSAHFTRQIGMPSHIACADLNPATKFFCQELSGWITGLNRHLRHVLETAKGRFNDSSHNFHNDQVYFICSQ